MTLSQNPAYNLKAVLKETGIKPDVLRAWERRYGVPMPQRTAGGHRLYSEHDIEMIKWLIGRQAEGLSISRAVEMWKEHAEQGRDPLAEAQAKTAMLLNLAATRPALPQLAETGVDAMRSHWLAACMSFNEIAAEQVLNQAFALYPVETVCLEVMQRGMAEMGGLWYENRASVQQEHFTSALAMRRLDSLLAGSPAPTRPQTVIVGCPSDEWHAFTPLLLSLFLRRRGLGIIYLGANVPADHFVETVETVNASLVVLASQQLPTAATLQHSAAQLAARGVPVAYGGRIFAMHPGLPARSAGHYLGDRLELAIERVDALLASHAGSVVALAPSAEYAQALQVFAARRAFVESDLNEIIHASGGGTAYLTIAHKFMGDNILAALQLGEITFLDSEIDWLNVLLEAQNVPPNAVYSYLASYSAAVSRQVGPDGALVTAWLDARVRHGRPNAK
jgi:DNA-binding transcriptional MerR regulator